MIRQAVILAAGMGQRIRESEDDLPKPLQLVGGVSLIKRTITTLGQAGIERVAVVVGFMAEAVRAAIEADPDYAAAGITIDFIDNPDYTMSNGVSLLKVRDRVAGPFVLSMSDHVYEPALPALAAAADMGAADLHLCVDRRIAEVYDIDDATKVRTEAGRIIDIGKTLADYDAIDCGVFAVGPALLDELAAALAEHGDCSLSDGVRRLAATGRAHTLDIGNAFWQDVDTPAARTHAESNL